MSNRHFRIFPLGDSALTVEFGNAISLAENKKAIALANHFEKDGFPGFIESVPAYASTTIFYDLLTVRKHFLDFPTVFDAVKNIVEEAVTAATKMSDDNQQIVELPVHFDPESALDLEFLADSHGLTPTEVIDIFTSQTYRVFMLGFLPGFTYMGEVDDRIATPRKSSPRTLIPKGSVGIAGKQTGIYSLASPGGWQIIGRTETELFTPNADLPSYLQPGDEVRFIAVK